ncbi:hypothetical protein [Burkholderia contaminans]|uniref:hypothetical protein n=1 Tax=Burkholderia contaminans TaxID=488447 RepID=UPI000F598AF2|nr:hypothetical protein [Burkholderia contaminans]RQT03265.1 hypothetical protein DF044_35995 [Burkholderia contaminans]
MKGGSDLLRAKWLIITLRPTPWMRAIDAHFEMFGFKPGDRVYLRFSFASRRVIITPDYSALNWREQPYGAAAQEEDEAEDYAALAALRGSTAW